MLKIFYVLNKLNSGTHVYWFLMKNVSKIYILNIENYFFSAKTKIKQIKKKSNSIFRKKYEGSSNTDGRKFT